MSASEGPYKLPEGWRWVRLGEIAEKPQYGYTSSAFSEPIGPKFLRITDITSGEIDWDSVPYCKIDAKVFRKYQLKPGDLLFARSGSIGATILIREVPYEAVFASYLIRVRLRVDALPEFVSLILKAPFCQKQFVPLGAAQKNINAKAIQQILLPLPPLSEQRRIVARIEELMGRIREARRLREEARQDTERLWQAVLAETFPRPGSELPEGWRWVKLGEVIKLKNGKFIRKSELTTSGPVRVYGSNGVIGYTSREKVLVDRETLAIGRVGASGVVNWVIPPAWISDNALYLVELAPDCDLKYLFHVLQQSGLASLAKQGAQPSISQEQVYQVSIPLPPLSEQRRIVAHLEAVQARIQALKEGQTTTEAELKRLEQAILEKAFRGEL